MTGKAENKCHQFPSLVKFQAPDLGKPVVMALVEKGRMGGGREEVMVICAAH